MVSSARNWVPTSRSGLRAPVATMQKSAAAVPPLVRSCQPKAPRARCKHARLLDLRAGLLGAFEEQPIEVEARVDEQRIVEFRVTSPACGAASTVSRTSRLGVGLSSRNGYCCTPCASVPLRRASPRRAFHRKAGPVRPADANCAAAKEPAGPPPRMATHFIRLLLRCGGKSFGDGIGAPPGAAVRHDAPPCGFSAPGAAGGMAPPCGLVPAVPGSAAAAVGAALPGR